ncbi:DNA repair protein [Roseobacter sp.]|uniref:DNA repair protein n=1 Tax=Roseobacter sp. TaxID=1907202 RepID=UPI00385B7437
MHLLRPHLSALQSILQAVSFAWIALAAVALVTCSVLAGFGLLPWIDLPLSLNDVPVQHAGTYAQLLLTALAVSLCFFLPSHRRVMKLEHAHHSFALRMEDVARAYALAHAADRRGLFHAASEFDAVKERMMHLRAHPDLETLEPDILELAAQMSRISCDLAQTYADEKVDRARDFLLQRQREMAVFQERLDNAKALHMDIHQWSNRLELDEAVAQSQLNHLIAELEEILPEIKRPKGSTATSEQNAGGVVRLANLAAE